MLNFLDPKLLPKVTCTAPATDNFESTNLISEKEAIRARGYMAYTVIKPPVELEFEFLCPVDINFVCLQTTVGRQKSTGIELFAKTPKLSYVSIAKAIYDNTGITFCDSKKFSRTNPPSFHNPNNGLFFFKSDKFRVFSDAVFLKVVIFKTDKSVPCLGSIKVYGKPGKSCTQVTINTIERIMGISPKEVTMKEETRSELKIPKDFIDDLTCEIMAIPMTLPSGNTIDKETLEKHIENEKSFGRKPGDPFTGLKFTETRKPVMNTALKSRIDLFLMQNSTNPMFFGIKRTLGRDSVNNVKRQKSEDNSEVCCVCHSPQFLYKITCKHFYCRNCLLTVENCYCQVCGQKFAKSDAVRYHL